MMNVTLKDKINSLNPRRRAKVERRSERLIAEERGAGYQRIEPTPKSAYVD